MWEYVRLALMALSWAAYLALMLIPVAAVFASRRERRGDPHAWLTTNAVLIACVVSAIVSPVAAAMLTPDWNPFTMLALAGTAWATAGFSAAFIWSYRKGNAARKAAAHAVCVAIVSPLLGLCWMIGGKIGDIY